MIKFFKSFGFAARGLQFALHEQTNIKVQIVMAILTIGCGYYFEITRMEWIAITLSIGLVITLEMINTSLEDLVDLVSPDYHPLAGRIKDIAAAAVLFAAIVAAVVGSIVFYPYLFS